MLDTKVDVKIKLAGIWTSVMFCYIYADYFGLYVPGRLHQMLGGTMPPLGPVSQWVLLGTSTVLAIPAVMIFLSLVLKPRLNRALNIGFGITYTLIILVTMWDWWFYICYGVIEITLTVLAVCYAWTWPKDALRALSDSHRSDP